MRGQALLSRCRVSTGSGEIKEERMLDRFMRILLIAAIGMITLVRPAAAASCENVASTLLQDGKITSATLVAAALSCPRREAWASPWAGREFLRRTRTCRLFAG